MREMLTQGMADAVTASRSPGAVVYVGSVDDTFYHGAYGLRQRVPANRPAQPDTIYDLASLTKVVATTTSIMLLRQEGALDLDAPASTYVPIPAFGRFTVRHLLTHTAGLVPGLPLYRSATSIDEMLQHYATVDLRSAPGTRYTYSDVGFMILGRIVELVGQDRLDAFCAKRIFTPLGMTKTGFKPPEAWRSNCAATEDCAWRGHVMMGEVHDENAYAVGGVSGHAGLFSTAADLARFSRALLSGRILPPETLAEMTRFDQTPAWPWQGIGWQIDPWGSSALGYLHSRQAFGHTGWTGTSMWLDRESGLFSIQLGNTCHPSRSGRNNGTYRRTFHAAVNKAFYPYVKNTHTGLDRLVRENFDAVAGKRIALLTNHAAVDCFGRHIIEVLGQSGARLAHIYSPEHGIRGQAEAGEAVPSEHGPIPVISLYGNRKTPSASELAGIDLFVVDLQDIGSRYYTYMATMKDCLEACGAAQTRVLVLDRPNPIGGAVLEGNLPTRTGSPVCCAAIPARHGMTMGELALHFIKHEIRGRTPTLLISDLDNWERADHFHQLSLPWIAPSPNIPRPETALIYAGTCLFEGTNLNEGRGTESPFELIGAPWLDSGATIAALTANDTAGCTVEPVTYTPVSMPGRAASPRHMDAVCNGIHIRIDEPRRVRSFRLAVALLCAIRAAHPRQLEWQPIFDLLAGGDALRTQIARGTPAAEILAAFEPDLRRFDSIRPRKYV